MVYRFSVAIIDDDIYEGEEYFMISVVDPSGFENITTSVVIQDNDGTSFCIQLCNIVCDYYFNAIQS